MESDRLAINEEILQRVVYGMENQKNRLLLDPADGSLRPESENDGRFIPMPPWGPTDGYRLMDGFAGTLPNTVLRERILEILQSGSGVFRHFKDALKERPEIERLWRQYKTREMRKAALSWLSRWNEAIELESLGPEPEEIEDLALSDFAFREAGTGDRAAFLRLERAAEIELTHTSLMEGNEIGSDGGLITVAENPGGDLIGFSRVFVDPERADGGDCPLHVYVLPDFRGLGIGRKLISMAIATAENSGAENFRLRTGVSGDSLAEFLKTSGFAPVVTLWRKSV